MAIQERYKPIPMAVNSTYAIPASLQGIGGFLCITSGTLTLVNNAGTTIVNAVPVTAGSYLPMPFALEAGQSGSITLAGGASGVVGF